MGSTTSRSENVKPVASNATELAPPTSQTSQTLHTLQTWQTLQTLQTSPTSPDPAFMEWCGVHTTDDAGRERVASALQPLVRGFIACSPAGACTMRCPAR